MTTSVIATRGLTPAEFSVGEHVLCYEPDPTKARVLYDSKVSIEMVDFALFVDLNYFRYSERIPTPSVATVAHSTIFFNARPKFST